MRILIVNNFAHVTGGADLHCLEVTKELRSRGHEVSWLSTLSEDNVETTGEFIRPSVTAQNRDELSWTSRIDVAGRAIWNPDGARAMYNLARSFAPDVVHVHKAYVQLSVSPVVVAGRLGIPMVQTVHDYEFLSASCLDPTGGVWDHDETKPAYRMLNSSTGIARRRIHRPRIDRWIAVSRLVSETYRKIGGIESTVIPNFSRDPSADPIPFEGRDGVLFLGRLSWEKGIEHIVSAAEALPDIAFTVAGNGPMRAEIVQAGKDLPNFSFRGFVDQVEARELLRHAKACLMPSLWQEPGPLACLESMAEGTPVICYPNGGLAEYVRDSNAGVICDTAKASALSAAISSLLTDSAKWDEHSSGGTTGAREKHSRSRYLDSLEQVYRSISDS